MDPVDTFYADVPNPLATQAAAQIYGQSILAFHAASGPTFFADTVYDNRRLYIQSELDQALSPIVQEDFRESTGARWDVRKLYTSHSPFLSIPTGLSQLIQDAIRKFEITFVR